MIFLMTKNDPNAFVTNKVLDVKLGEVVDTLLKGMDNMLEEQKKIFATKEDLNKVSKELLLTKNDLKAEISWVKDDINGLTAELAGVSAKRKFKN